MEVIYDVIIAGGGIAGSYAARELSKAKLKVLLIDQVSTLGSTAGTPKITVEKFSLPKEGINTSFNGIILGTLKKEKKWTSENNIGYVLDYKRMCELMFKEVEKNGGIIFGESTVDSLIRKNEKIVGVKTSKGDYYGKYIVDATGTAGILLSEAGLRKRVPCPPSVGIEYVVEDSDNFLNKYTNSLAIYFDIKLFHFGYGWVFCNGKNNYKIGVCEYDVESHKHLPDLKIRLDQFMLWLLEDKEVKILEKHGGSIFAGPNFKVNKIMEQNLLGIGDTMGSFNPLFGEGIRHALESAEFAVQSILKQIKIGKGLGDYEVMWKNYIGLRWKFSTFLGLALYEKNTAINQELYEKLVIFNENINETEFEELVFGFSPLPILKKFPKNIDVIFAFLKARFLNFD